MNIITMASMFAGNIIMTNTVIVTAVRKTEKSCLSVLPAGFC